MKKTSTARGGKTAADTPTMHAALPSQALASFSPWAAMLTLLQLFIGDRADCARQCTWSWIAGIGPGDA